MEEKLQMVLKEYILDVEMVCKLLLKSINASENLNLKNKYDFFQYRADCKKMVFWADGICYRLHGKGCMAFGRQKFINWDFGYRSRWCGISPWHVSQTLRKNHSPYMEYYDGGVIQTVCKELVKIGIMFQKDNQYYFEMADDETFQPEFPSEYDELVIEHSGLNWTIPRNKEIDRFIRKSTRVHNQINDSKGMYRLTFLFQKKEVCTIPYDDVCYPENAVKIMSDRIIRHLNSEIRQECGKYY